MSDIARDDLAFLPLGGTGEIGMNFNLYRCQGRFLAIDCGIGFAGPAHPEAEILVPDPSFIAARRGALLGLVLTHAHEDHLGAVAHLWPYLRCPVYATPFAAAILRRKLAEAHLLGEVVLHVVAPGGEIDLSPFRLRMIRMAHSIPEAQALVIETPAGLLLHTGDWKLDPAPLVGPPTDEAALAALGERGVLAMICDSTNAMVEGHSGSEAGVRRSLAALIRGMTGRVAVTCFASNVARIESIALAAAHAGRSVAVVGRSLRNLDASARASGYFATLPAFVSEDAAEEIPDDNLLILVTGSQGEPRSALARIAADTHPRIALGEGDTVVFSSRVIPGNERAIGIVQDNLSRRGVRVMTEADHMVHVSGHPARDELRRLYRLVRPRYVVPVHGEWRHLTAHADLAQTLGAQPILIEDGDVLRLAPGAPVVEESVPVGRLAVDGRRLLPLAGGVMAARRRMMRDGVVVASFAIDHAGRLRGDMRISAPGLFEPADETAHAIAEDFAKSLAELPLSLRQDESALNNAARAALRRVLGRRLEKRPEVEIHLLRV